ncbi:hypothetical protein E7Z57_17490 (plasmid) [Ralstonia pseudosolanacearum]|uniref:Uncharacterized protein n=1 Tax=Ralstonia solanacearum TaxID=305 RepID=A0AA92EF83_RALSL|nr:hypothetical protein E7Z57_17490 [Ralstonia pseudosolanacearum]
MGASLALSCGYCDKKSYRNRCVEGAHLHPANDTPSSPTGLRARSGRPVHRGNQRPRSLPGNEGASRERGCPPGTTSPRGLGPNGMPEALMRLQRKPQTLREANGRSACRRTFLLGCRTPAI